MVLMIKSWWFVMVFVVETIRIFYDVLLLFFSAIPYSVFFLGNACFGSKMRVFHQTFLMNPIENKLLQYSVCACVCVCVLFLVHRWPSGLFFLHSEDKLLLLHHDVLCKTLSLVRFISQLCLFFQVDSRLQPYLDLFPVISAVIIEPQRRLMAERHTAAACILHTISHLISPLKK